MKSSPEELKRRGVATQHDVDSFRGRPQNDLIDLLRDENAVVRTASACNFLITQDNEKLIATELLKALCIEKCLYTKIAICEKLEEGGIKTARLMSAYLGKVGNNRHKKLPDRVSHKKTYPLPRDIIARSLGKMSPAVYPVLKDVLQSDETEKISEALDAIGFMTYHNKRLSNDENVRVVLEVMDRYKTDSLILWKAIISLSAFPLEKTKRVLEYFMSQNNLLGEEAKRSMKFIETQFIIPKEKN